jgi:hypothetical protein
VDNHPMELNCSIRITANEASLRVGFTVMTADRAAHSGADETYTLDEITRDRFRQIIIRNVALILESAVLK